MYRAFISILAGGMAIASSSAFGQAMDTKADCNKDAAMWMTAYNKGDAETIANFYEPDSGTFSNPFWTASGHAALLAGFKQEMASGGQVTSIVCEHANRVGGKNVADGTWAVSGKGPDGKETTMQGHWMAVSEVREGKPVVLTHVSNMDALPPSAPK